MEIKNPRLKELLLKKDEIVKEGRKISGRIEIIDLKIEKNKDKQRKYTAACEPQDLIKKGNELEKIIESSLTELEKIQKEVHSLKLANIPATVAKEYEELKAEKEKMEIERNKLALKVQKIKDRSIPIIQKEVKPHLKEFEDIETAEVKDNAIVVKTFSHLDEWMKKYKESQNK